MLGSDKSLEELGFVPRAVGEPLPVKHMCDKKCDEKRLKFCELAAIVTEEGGMPHTINHCRHCCGYRLIVGTADWNDLITHKTSRGRLWASFEIEWFHQENMGAVQAAKDVQLETDCSRQPHMEELELLRMGNNMRLEAPCRIKLSRRDKRTTGLMSEE